MSDLQNIINLQLEIVLLIASGFVLTKLQIITKSVRKGLTDLIICFILPCNIIDSFRIDFNRSILISCAVILFISFGIQIVSSLLGKVLYPGVSDRQRSVLRYATIVSNAGFMGSPVAYGMYGQEGLLYAAVYLIPQRIAMWSAGLSCFTTDTGSGKLKKVLTHPCIVAVFIGLVLMLTALPLPVFLSKTLSLAGNCNTALSMIVIGSILTDVPWNSIFNRLTLWYSLVRLCLIPLIVILVCRFLPVPELSLKVSVVLAGMPAAATSAILADKYNGDSQLAVRLICLSTLLSLLTIPVISMLA